MNASLVAFYGTTPKPPEIEKLTSYIQDVLEGEKGLGFIRYKPNQVHATVAGLEGLRVGEQIVSTNVAELRRRVKLLDLEDVVRRLRSSRHLPLKVRLGGFELASNYSFASRGLHPQIRSFSIQGRIVVAMGWPVAGPKRSLTLLNLIAIAVSFCLTFDMGAPNEQFIYRHTRFKR